MVWTVSSPQSEYQSVVLLKSRGETDAEIREEVDSAIALLTGGVNHREGGYQFPFTDKIMTGSRKLVTRLSDLFFDVSYGFLDRLSFEVQCLDAEDNDRNRDDQIEHVRELRVEIPEKHDEK